MHDDDDDEWKTTINKSPNYIIIVGRRRVKTRHTPTTFAGPKTAPGAHTADRLSVKVDTHARDTRTLRMQRPRRRSSYSVGMAAVRVSSRAPVNGSGIFIRYIFLFFFSPRADDDSNNACTYIIILNVITRRRIYYIVWKIKEKFIYNRYLIILRRRRRRRRRHRETDISYFIRRSYPFFYNNLCAYLRIRKYPTTTTSQRLIPVTLDNNKIFAVSVQL